MVSVLSLRVLLAASAVPGTTVALPASAAQAYSLSVVHEFPASYAQTPKGLALASDGNLYGSTSATQGSRGTVFRFSSGGVFSTVAIFNYAREGGPFGAPFVGHDGSLHGVAFDGGPGGGGTVYRIDPSGAITTQYAFDGTTGLNPASLVQAPDGGLIGVAVNGGANNGGTVFRLAPDNRLSVLASCGVHDCYLPTSVFRAAEGTIYGTAEGDTSGYKNHGQIFQATPSFHTAFSFNRTRANTPIGLLPGPNNTIVGLTNDFQAGRQTFFSFRPPHTVRLVGSYAFPLGGPRGLTLGGDGNYYGTLIGDVKHAGGIFRLTPAGTFSVVATFDGTNGAGPEAITSGSDGALYGTTDQGGATGGGVIFRLSLQ